MTIAISLKVFDGLVLAADSASTVQVTDSSGGESSFNVYNNGNKIFNLRKGLPIGAVTWGLASIGAASNATLMKDLRARLTGSALHQDWKIDPENYTVEDVANRTYEYIYNERYLPTFGAGSGDRSPMGFIVAGYSSGDEQSDEFRIDIAGDGSCVGPVRLRPKEEEGGISWNGQPEAIYRLIFGFSSALPGVLESKLGIPADQIPAAIAILRSELQAPVIVASMPIQDAIDLAAFLADLTAKYSRFSPGHATVGGPIEIAAITRHEGFKWVQRKHYYHQELNPGGDR